MPDEIGAELDAVQVVRLALVVEPHLLKLRPVIPWIDGLAGLEEESAQENEDKGGDKDITNDPLHVVVEVVGLVPAIAPVWVVAHLSCLLSPQQPDNE